MYLKKFTIEGIKCFDSIELHFPHENEDYGGWIVLLGSNGTGKSTLLQAIALTLIGPLAGQRLLQPQGWVSYSSSKGYGELTADIIRGEQDSQVGQPRKKPYEVRFAVTGNQMIEIDKQNYDQPQLVLRADGKDRKSLVSGPYGAKRAGWFCCGYGPFRRLSGGDAAEAKLVYSQGVEARFATLFRESAALTMCQDWLTQLYSRSIDPSNAEKEQSERDYNTVRKVIDRLLPGTVRIEKIDTTMVYFRTIGDAIVPVPDLSDGYRSFLALTVDMLRHVVESNVNLSSLISETDTGIQVNIEGVVLIDEADAHLHPMWQRSIGFKLREVFPKIQFIVTTHSPFVAQAATDGGLIVLRSEENGQVNAVRPVESVKGWQADVILTSPLFGLTGTRDEETEKLIREHAELNTKRGWQAMSSKDQDRLSQLESTLSERMNAPGESWEERQRHKEMMNYVESTLQNIGAEK